MKNQTKGQLRVMTAGSVDDGKSTLIGRLLYDSKMVFTDQLEAIERSKFKRVLGKQPDLSLLTDGLEAEREQGITIDVAYRYFSTAKRKFIIADTPGHEMYTRNMVTAASTVNAVILLVDATKLNFDDAESTTLLIQTLRHTTICHLLKVEHFIVAVNKLDLLEYDGEVFARIVRAFKKFASPLNILDKTHFIPMAALPGDNVVTPSSNMPWYKGPTLIELLENLPVDEQSFETQPFRFPVQLVSRQNGHEARPFRGYMGRIESGAIRIGDEIVAYPSGHKAQVTEIFVSGKKSEFARAKQSITLCLSKEIDISRGDLISKLHDPITKAHQLKAQMCWLSEDPLEDSRRFLLKLATKTVPVRVERVESILDVNTQEDRVAGKIELNDIVKLTLNLQSPLIVDNYREIKSMGSFILIDEVSNNTIGAGLVST